MTTQPQNMQPQNMQPQNMQPQTDAEIASANLLAIFGFRNFRRGQVEVIDVLLAGRPALAIFPTGGGKSLCYQLPALQLPGLTLVISPLIALMKDQVDQLQKLGIAAEKLDSSVDAAAARTIYSRMADGSLKLLYVAPERLGNEGFRARLRRTRISLLAIDEAHCISEWGHNFRPDYLKIATFAAELQLTRILALTATATPAVAADVRRAFQIREEDHIQTGFHRPNLTLRVHRCTAEARLPLLLERLAQQRQESGSRPGGTIVYVTLQKTAEQVAKSLCTAGFDAAVYHAGLQTPRRTQVQERFMAGEVPIVVATIAFGMGIDKADIRAVYHYNLPKSLESYSQEIGRAGRDGLPARCELLASGDDQAVLDNFSFGDTPTRHALKSFVDQIFAERPSFSVSRYTLSREHDMRPLVVATVLTYLELEGILRATGPFYSGYKVQFRTPQEEIYARFNPDRAAFLQSVFQAGKQGPTWLTLHPDELATQLDQPRQRIADAVNYLEQQGDLTSKPSGLRHGYHRLLEGAADTVVHDLAQLFEQREQKDLARTARVVTFAERDTCLTAALIGYFGEQLPGDSHDHCGHCGPCLQQDTVNAEAVNSAGISAGNPTKLPRSTTAEVGPTAKKLIEEVAREAHAALRHPRALARFLCGLRSPATQGKGGLQRDRRFGRLRHASFLEVLAVAERVTEHT